MAGPKFFETRMGRSFYMRDIPAIIRQLKRIATALEGLHNEKKAFMPEPSLDGV